MLSANQNSPKLLRTSHFRLVPPKLFHFGTNWNPFTSVKFVASSVSKYEQNRWSGHTKNSPFSSSFDFREHTYTSVQEIFSKQPNWEVKVPEMHRVSISINCRIARGETKRLQTPIPERHKKYVPWRTVKFKEQQSCRHWLSYFGIDYTSCVQTPTGYMARERGSWIMTHDCGNCSSLPWEV